MNKTQAFGLAAITFAAIAPAMADEVKAGLNETGNVHVDSGIATQGDPVVLGDNAKFYKTGAGELVLSLANVNRQRDLSVTALGGKLTLVAGDDATVDVSAPPAILQNSAFWVNTDSVVVTNDEGLVSKWCDVRETTPESPTLWYAEPSWGTRATTYKGIPPRLASFHGRPGVYFHGRESNVYMRFMKNGVGGSVTDIRNIFLVHGVSNCWGAAIGYATSRMGGMVPGVDSYIRDIANCESYFVRRADLDSDFAGGRFHLDGALFDPFTTIPKVGVSLLECDFLTRESNASYFFRTNFETYQDKGNQGGDYICEAIIFTGTLLSEKDRLDIERYLMKKWNLPYVVADDLRLPIPEVTVGVASNATVEITAADDEQTTPFTFTGEGSVRKTGGGAMLAGPSCDTPFSGDFSLDGGSVISAGGRPPAVTAMPGDVYNSSRHLFGNAEDTSANRTPGNIAESGMRLTRATNGAPGVFRKTGPGEVRVSRIDRDVASLDVAEGVVTLESRTKATMFEPCATVVTASVPNASFEMPITADANARQIINDSTVNEWTAIGAVDYGTSPHANWSLWAREPPPDGNGVIMIHGGAKAQTTVAFPRAGRYEVSLWACDRYGQQFYGRDIYGVSQIDLMLGRDAESLERFGTILPYGTRFTKFRFTTPEVEAGDYVLRFSSPYKSYDESTAIDGVKITYIAEKAARAALEVPNGDFETQSPRSAHPVRLGFFNALDKVEGWTFEIANATYANCLTNFGVGVAAPQRHIYGNGTGNAGKYQPLYPYGAGGTGSACLAFVHGYGRATSATFTVPAGTWRLRCNAAWAPMNVKRQDASGAWVEVGGGGRPAISASLAVTGGATLQLGSITPTSTLPAETFWPSAVTFAEATEVSLVLAQANTGASGTIDDLALVGDGDYDAGELLKNGGFESMTGWSTSYDRSHYKYSEVYWMPYTFAPLWAYGYNVFEGLYRCGLKNECLITQTVHFPTAGLHCFRLHANTRIDSDDAGQNPLRFWYHAVGSAETNVIDVMQVPRCFNWFEREYIFDVPVAGDYKLGIEGGYSLREGGYGVQDARDVADHLTFIDGCSIRRVMDGLEDAPETPDGLMVSIAEGSRLVLNYPGSIKVARLSLGGGNVSGIVNAKTHPRFIGGMGEIEVVPGSTVIILR